MRVLAAIVLMSVVSGCDAGADVDAAPGRFTADLSGDRSASVEGDASFDISPCGGRFVFESTAGTLVVSKECFEADDRAREQRYPIDTAYREDGFQAEFETPDGAHLRGVGGYVEFVDVERGRIEGRFSVEAAPATRETPLGSALGDPTLTITGTFNAGGVYPPPGYD